MGSWLTMACWHLMACSNIFLINDSMNKREWTYIFGSLCLLTTLVPSFRNYRLWSFFGLVMISYTAWYMTIGALVHGQVIYLPRSSRNQSLYLIILYDELGVISVSWLVVDFHYIVDSKSIWEGILIHWNPVSITCSTNPWIRFASFIKMMTVQGFHVSCHPTCWNMRMSFMGVRCKSAKRTTFTVQFHV